jgi:outer membrane immunogenic protein
MRSGLLASTFAAALLVTASASAQAADMYAKAPPTYYDWTGFYAGLHAGWEDAETKGLSMDPGAAFGFVGFLAGGDFGPTEQRAHGWLGGGQFGYNYQIRRAVLGFEVSGSWSGINNTLSGQGGSAPGVSGLPAACSQFVSSSVTVTCTVKQDWTFNALTRLGYTFVDGRLLTYVTGGGALTQLNVSTTDIESGGARGATYGGTRIMPGVALGAGAQFALGYGFSIGAEYLYTKYATQDFSNLGTCAGTTCNPKAYPITENHDLATNTVRAVLNYKFE